MPPPPATSRSEAAARCATRRVDRRRRRYGPVSWVALALVMASAAVACGRAESASPEKVGRAAASIVPGTTSTSTTTTTAPPAQAGFAAVPLPLPDPLPADPFAPTPQVVLGTIEIPTLGVTAPLQEGVTLTAINRGPGHWPGTPLPGGRGNMVVAGHRTSWSKPFADLDRLVAGDRVLFHTDAGTSVYEVRGVFVVPAAHIGIAAQHYTHTATLFACHPKGQATERIVARLRLLGPDGTPVDPDDSLPPLDAGTDATSDTTLLVRGPGTQVLTQVVDPLVAADG